MPGKGVREEIGRTRPCLAKHLRLRHRESPERPSGDDADGFRCRVIHDGEALAYASQNLRITFRFATPSEVSSSPALGAANLDDQTLVVGLECDTGRGLWVYRDAAGWD